MRPADVLAASARHPVRRVLLVSYHFPPDPAVGALRCGAFARYLPSLGWRPYVLSVRHAHVPAGDGDDAPGPDPRDVCRTRALPSLRQTALALHLLLRPRSTRPAAPAPADPAQPFEGAVGRAPTRTLNRWLLALCWLPDDRTGWLPPAVVAGWRLCRQERIDAIVSSGPPHTAHLVALSLHQLTRLPWVADFRDPWTDNPGKPWFVRSALSDRVEHLLERRVVRSAAHLLTATDRAGAGLVRRHPRIASKLTTVWTGFEPTGFDALGAVPPAPTFTLAHVGTVYLNRSPRALLEALALLTRDGRIPRSQIRLVFVGETIAGRAALVGQAEALGLSPLVTFVGRVSYDEALRWMLRAHLLVLLAQGQPAQIPTKSFEYLASGTPLLAIMEEGATADLLRSTKTPVVPDDPAVIAEEIHHHFVTATAARAPYAWRRAEVLPYTRERATEALASILDAAVGAR